MQDCSITDAEYHRMYNGRWGSSENTGPVIIPFTFKPRAIPFESYLSAALSWKIDTEQLSETGKEVVRAVLLKWEEICDGKIKFKEVDFLKPLEAGAEVLGCTNMGEKTSGVTSFQRNRSGKFFQSVVCLKPDFNANTTSAIENVIHNVVHEFGHLVGLDHPHEIPSLLTRLKATPKGSRCSIMTYINNIYNNFTQCQGSPICGKGGYAIKPGPIDGEVCKRIYSGDIKKFDSMSYIFSPFFVAVWGLFFSAVELIIAGFLNELKFRNEILISKKYVEPLTEMILWLALQHFEFPTNIQTSVLASVIAKFLAAFQTPEDASNIKIAVQLLSVGSLVYTLLKAISTHDYSDIFSAVIILLICKFSIPRAQLINAGLVGKGAGKIFNGVSHLADGSFKKVYSISSSYFHSTLRQITPSSSSPQSDKTFTPDATGKL